MKFLIKPNQRTTPNACSLVHLSGVQGNITNRRKSKIKNSRTNEMQLVSLDLRVLFTSSSRLRYEDLCEKILPHNTSWHQKWVSRQHYRRDFGQPSNCSQCSTAGHHYAILLHQAVWKISFMSIFDSYASSQAFLTAMCSFLLLLQTCSPPPPPRRRLLEPHQQPGGFGLPCPKPALLLMGIPMKPHTA